MGDSGSEILTIQNTNIQVKQENILFVKEEIDMDFPGDIVGIVGMGYTHFQNFLDYAA